MKNEELIIKDSTANPAPLGLLGFAMTTILLNIHNAGFFPLDVTILSMGIFYGGIAQIIAGIMEWKKQNTFGTIAFISYGFFWISLVAIIIMPKLGMTAASPLSMGMFLLLWGIFSLFMFIGTLKATKGLQIVFLTLTILFFLLVIRDFTGDETIGKIAGFEGIICGLCAFYNAIAQILNEMYKKTVLPLG